MSAPFQLTLCWNQVIAHDIFSNFIRHAFSTLRSFGQKTGNSKDYILYLEYLRECLVGFKTFDVSAANKVRKEWGAYSSLDGREIFGVGNMNIYNKMSLQSFSIGSTIYLLEEWSGLTAPYNPEPSYINIKPRSITKLIYLAVAKEKRRMNPRTRAMYGNSHISDEDSVAEMKWQKSLLLKYLFGMPISENDLKDDRPISPNGSPGTIIELIEKK